MMEQKKKYIYKKAKDFPLLAIDVPFFKEFFDPELNPKLDIQTLTPCSNSDFYYQLKNGDIKHTRVFAFCKRVNHPDENTSGLAKNCSYFMEKFDAKLNPELNLGTLTMGSKKRINYKTRLGTIGNTTVKELCRDKKKMRPNKRKVLEKMYPRIAFCCEDESDIACVCLDCRRVFELNKLSIFHSNANYLDIGLCPYCRIGSGRKRCIDDYPNVISYWSSKNSIDIHEALFQHTYIFECPYCGAEFKRLLQTMAKNNILCPKCRDKGDNIEEISYDNLYLRRI